MKKKIILALLILALALSLCSCKVNWFDETYDVPWWTIALPIALISVVGYKIIFSQTYVCPSCKAEIIPKWYELSALVHFGRARLMKCRSCGRFGYCKIKKD